MDKKTGETEFYQGLEDEWDVSETLDHLFANPKQILAEIKKQIKNGEGCNKSKSYEKYYLKVH